MIIRSVKFENVEVIDRRLADLGVPPAAFRRAIESKLKIEGLNFARRLDIEHAWARNLAAPGGRSAIFIFTLKGEEATIHSVLVVPDDARG